MRFTSGCPRPGRGRGPSFLREWASIDDGDSRSDRGLDDHAGTTCLGLAATRASVESFAPGRSGDRSPGDFSAGPRGRRRLSGRRQRDRPAGDDRERRSGSSVSTIPRDFGPGNLPPGRDVAGCVSGGERVADPEGSIASRHAGRGDSRDGSAPIGICRRASRWSCPTVRSWVKPRTSRSPAAARF